MPAESAVYYRMRSAVALADDRFQEAIDTMRQAKENSYCLDCGYADLGRAYEGLGLVDSVLAEYERFVSRPGPGPASFILPAHRSDLPPVLIRLGELYAERGDRERALEYYSRFVDLWNDADEELQPQVAEVRERMARLVEGRVGSD